MIKSTPRPLIAQRADWRFLNELKEGAAGMRRRELLRGAMAAGATAALAGRSRTAEAEPPPETTRITLLQTASMCQAPQYVAEDLLRGEGFTDVRYIDKGKDGQRAIADALASGEASINMHFSGPLILRPDAGAPITILAGVTHATDKSIALLAEGKIDAFMGFPPDPQEIRARKIGHVVVNSNVDRPWSQYFCCVVAATASSSKSIPSPPSAPCGPS